jgi:hypothetical protein
MSDYEPSTHSVVDNSDIPVKNDVTASKTKSKVPFWSENPNIILNTSYVFEFFPTDTMSYSQKLNAISRLVIALTVVGFILTRSFRVLLISIITLFSLHLIYGHHIKSDNNDKDLEGFGLEGFGSPALDMLKDMNKSTSPEVFDKPSPENPFSNVLMNDYDYNPNKKPAPPIAKPEISDNILTDAKTMVQKMNPGQPNIADKLFRDLGEQFVFEQSLRPFYSTASTTIPNDQAGFADFCYGSMISCKEGNLFACARNNSSKYINQ